MTASKQLATKQSSHEWTFKVFPLLYEQIHNISVYAFPQMYMNTLNLAFIKENSHAYFTINTVK